MLIDINCFFKLMS